MFSSIFYFFQYINNEIFNYKSIIALQCGCGYLSNYLFRNIIDLIEMRLLLRNCRILPRTIFPKRFYFTTASTPEVTTD